MDKVVVYAGTRNVYDPMYVSLKSLLINNKIDRVYLLIEDDEFPYPIPKNVYPVNVSEQNYFSEGKPHTPQPRVQAVLHASFHAERIHAVLVRGIVKPIRLVVVPIDDILSPTMIHIARKRQLSCVLP